LVDAVLFLCFLVVAVATPLIGSQTFPCNEHLPRALADLHNWYSCSYGDSLVTEKPHFFVGLVWLELALLRYGIVAARPWLSTTCLIDGVSVFTGMVGF
ncbi:hypothetical protein CRG98_021631, partial [Punica granatum]